MSPHAKGAIRGGMQSWPMTVNRFIEHAARWHGDREVISFGDDGVTERTNYAAIRSDAARLSNALVACGITPGDRVATLATNSTPHLTAWYAISGIGAICHTLNPRMSEDQLAWVIDHAQDCVLMVDGTSAEVAEQLFKRCPSVTKLLYFTRPQGSGSGQPIREFYADSADDCQWGQFDEELAAGLCYTSGTTGNPKGVLYSHRSNVLHTLITIQPDAFRLSVQDTIMPIVPMYHANAWGLVYAAPAVGAKLVLPGSKLDGATLFKHIRDEGVTFAAAVPTAWLGLLDYLETHDEHLPTLSRALVGGAAMPEQLLRRFDARGIEAIAAWGMTESSPVAGVSTALPVIAAMSREERVPYRLKQGRVPFGVDMRIVGDDRSELPHDGLTPGALQIRGPAVAAGYFGAEADAIAAGGFFDTGDIATIDPLGYVKFTDRAKDVIKSGGEWISSIEIESVASLFPGVTLAAVIGMPHPRWDERPLLLLTTTDDDLDIDALRNYLGTKLPKWWLPDEIRIVDALSLGHTGKLDKKAIRARFL
jgi:fatty-acyl-CoA synthase